MSSSILYVVHNQAWTDCRVAEVLRSRGHTIEFVCPAFGDTLPPVDGYTALVIGGSEDGHAARPDELQWVADEIAYIREAVDKGVPTYGICMGAQLLAAAYDGKIWGRPDELCELGFYQIDATEAGRDLFEGTSHFYEAHYEGIFRLPDNAVLLARGNQFPVQAFRIGDHAYGTQFHPDVALEKLTREFLENDPYIDFFGAQSVEEQLRLAAVYEDSIQAWTERFIDTWVGSACSEAEAA
ncbi:MAG: gamma-glutamyl-gamma-aminobutyrate hydrolase family protein [Rhodospirillales bacterium]|nr:gamma-glutamyl-gamma-aminobutyrate hydrolase family protein [Rhodospirillales bacterium]